MKLDKRVAGFIAGIAVCALIWVAPLSFPNPAKLPLDSIPATQLQDVLGNVDLQKG